MIANCKFEIFNLQFFPPPPSVSPRPNAAGSPSDANANALQEVRLGGRPSATACKKVRQTGHVAADPADGRFGVGETGRRRLVALAGVDPVPAAQTAQRPVRGGGVVELQMVRVHAIESQRAAGTVNLQPNLVLPPVAIFVASIVPKAPDGNFAKHITQSSASTAIAFGVIRRRPLG